jgi:predicted nucleic acid-binding protein
MGSLESIPGPRVYLDANIFIYYLEDFPQFAPVLDSLFRRLDRGELHAVTSELTLAEILVKPLQAADATAVSTYQSFLGGSSSLTVAPVTRDILIAAARLRAGSSLKLPDAIHAATSLQHRCTSYLTNDQRLRPMAP